MNITEFLNHVQGHDGNTILMFKSSIGTVYHKTATNFNEIRQLVGAGLKRNEDVYFAVAKFSAGVRKKEHVLNIKSLWLDVDCGKVGAYPDKKTAYAELVTFCKKIGLPKPICIDSGGGMHVYWPLTTPINIDRWLGLNNALKASFQNHGFLADPAVMEPVRVLRLPNTVNFKYGAAPVKIVVEGNETTPETMELILNTKPPVATINLQGQLPKNAQFKFNTHIAPAPPKRCSVHSLVKNRPCKNFAQLYDRRIELGYEEWVATLLVAKGCIEEDAPEFVSKDHPAYDGNATAKADSFGGVATCELLEKVNPNGCVGCKYKGKVKTPLVINSTDIDPEIPVAVAPKISQFTGHTIPEGYTVVPHGGVYFGDPIKNPDNASLVCPYEVYATKRLRDPAKGYIISLEVLIAHDGWHKFDIETSKLAEVGKMKDTVAAEGLLMSGPQYVAFHRYLQMCHSALQQKEKAAVLRMQMGWTEDWSFVVGDKIFTPAGSMYNPPVRDIRRVARYIHQEGSFQEWKNIMSIYGNVSSPLHKFAVLTAFGAPLMKLIGLEGGVINLLSSASGTGKTTVLRLCNSVFGHPTYIGCLEKDTVNAREAKLGILNSLANTNDEMTNIGPKEASDYLYAMTQGRTKDRMQGAVNALRDNDSTWSNLSICSSNASFHDKLSSIKQTSDGERYRLIELYVPVLGKDDLSLKKIFDQTLTENYGFAGVIYADYLVKYRNIIRERLNAMRLMYDGSAMDATMERFWTAMIACNITGGWIASELGLIDWDMSELQNYGFEVLNEARRNMPSNRSLLNEHKPIMVDGCIKPAKATAELSDVDFDLFREIIASFLNDTIDNTLTINHANANDTSPMPKKEPRNSLVVRFEPNVSNLYINEAKFRNHCVSMQGNYHHMREMLVKSGACTPPMAFNLGEGLRTATASQRCLIFDVKHALFDGINIITEENIAPTD